MTKTKPPLPDAPAREAIASDVDVNMVVEAAAGTGKTTSLVARLMTLFRKGALAGDGRIAAVTFTHKAASELRDRLEQELARALATPEDLPAEEKAGLEAAAKVLPECHIGTIHSFCARLLRERPVEAGIGLDFAELEESADLLLRREAWRQFADAMRRGEQPAIQRVFRTFDLDLEALANGFTAFAEYPDVEEWPGDSRRLDDLDAEKFLSGLAEYRTSIASRLPEIVRFQDYGNDKAIPSLQIMERRWPRLARPLEIADAHRLSRVFKDGFQVKVWQRLGLDKEEAAEAKAAYAHLLETVVKPFRRDCLAAVYAASLAAFRETRTIYDRLRRERRELNFQDLLMLTARLLREYPEVRADLAERFPRLLVDEVQDTDPVQAEIMFLLAAIDSREKDWRRCRPRPGSLFIVGDPKQSIYRFRRADIATYQEMKRLLVDAGGRMLGLTSNFRGQPALLDWVNRTFCLPEDTGASPEAEALSGRFSRRESSYNPEYMDLSAGREANPAAFSGVYYLESQPAGSSRGDSLIRTRDLAWRIAGFIRNAVDQGLPLPAGDGVKPAAPGDFLIVTYRKKEARVFAEAVRRLGLACRISSGSTLADSRSLALLLGYLRALTAPDDPILWTAVLRGGLFGVDDPALYRWKKAGGRFDLLSPLPDNGDEDMAERFRLGKSHLEWMVKLSPVLATERIADDLGLWQLAALGQTGPNEAAALEVCLETLRREADSLATPGALAERLAWLIDNYDDDPLPGSDAPAVRVMNLHKTKGLEAPVVFLTCPRTAKKFKPEFVVRRGGAVQGALCLKGSGRSEVMACPADWKEMEASEELFLAAERTRLNYVAATRAGAVLVYTVHKMRTKGWNCHYLPEFIPGETIPEPLPEPEAITLAEAVPQTVDETDLAAAREDRQNRRGCMLTETYQVQRAKPEGDWGLPGGATADGGRAMDIGEILHALMASDAKGEDLRALAENLLRQYQLSGEDAGELAGMVEAAKKSKIGRRAERAERVFRETPYSLPVAGADGIRLQRGVIDLAFREQAGWVIVDYKSDRPDATPSDESPARRHAGQLAAYRSAWEAITGETVAETGVYFLRTGEYVIVNEN